MVDLGSNILITPIIENRLKHPIKRHSQTKKKKKTQVQWNFYFCRSKMEMYAAYRKRRVDHERKKISHVYITKTKLA